jgi:tetrapyrrole methylase family protein/MazG family protein
LKRKKTLALEDFVETIARLRGPDGCPWDREQTHKSLARYLLEETYEVLEAIHEGDPDKLKDELGDLLLQIMLNAQVAKDDGNFDIEDVAAAINEKMIRRHPHVFGENKLSKASQVVTQWQEIKATEKTGTSQEQASALDGVPKHMPALLQALKISEKAVHQGFEWAKEEDVWAKLDSEIVELKEAIANPEATHPQTGQEAAEDIALEFGDMLFCMVNLARWHNLNPEECLLMTIEKFKARFHLMEKTCQKPLKEMSLEELDLLWEKAKATLKKEKISR